MKNLLPQKYCFTNIVLVLQWFKYLELLIVLQVKSTHIEGMGQ